MAAKIATTAMVIISSIKVKPRFLFMRSFSLEFCACRFILKRLTAPRLPIIFKSDRWSANYSTLDNRKNTLYVALNGVVMSKHRTNGFTLIELIVTIAVLAIILAIAVPSFQDFFERGRLRGAGDEVAALVATARGEAVKTGRNVTMSFSGTTASWCLGAIQQETPDPGDAYEDDIDCDCTVANECLVDGVERVMRSSDFGGVTLAAIPTTNDFIVDGKQGAIIGLTTRQATLISPKGTYRLQLDISPMGQTRLCVPSGQRAMPGFPSC